MNHANLILLIYLRLCQAKVILLAGFETTAGKCICLDRQYKNAYSPLL